jgi:hypothetical protein
MAAAANGGFEPIIPDAAPCANGSFRNQRKRLHLSNWIEAVAPPR